MHAIRLGPEVKRLRQGLGLTQRDIAIRLDVSPGYLSQLENGLVPPPSEAKTVLLAEILGVEPDRLLALTGRVPTDVTDLLKGNPHLWTAVRAAAQN